MLSKKILENIEPTLKQYVSGTLIVVRLTNIDEINLLLPKEKLGSMFKMFHELVKKSSAILMPYDILVTDTPNEVYIVSYNKPNIVRKFADIMYASIQLDLNQFFEESYLRVVIGSINFLSNRDYDIETIIYLLHYMVYNTNDVDYYYCYESNKIDISGLISRNKNLSVIRHAIKNNNFLFFYQPIIDRKTGQINYFECLLRIKQDDELLPISSVIEDAENTGLIHIIDSMVLDMAVKELENDDTLSLAINISNYGIRSNYLLYKATKLLARSSIAPRLIIEITETSINKDYNATKRFIDALHLFGCRFALDDFGSGFTSFKQLNNLPLDIIKIDGSYIQNISNNNHNQAFVTALITLASNLNLKTVAEFVEDNSIVKCLSGMKIDAMQGNYFAPASPTRKTHNYIDIIL